MATVNSGIREDANFLNLRKLRKNRMKSEVNNMLVQVKTLFSAFRQYVIRWFLLTKELL